MTINLNQYERLKALQSTGNTAYRKELEDMDKYKYEPPPSDFAIADFPAKTWIATALVLIIGWLFVTLLTA